MRLLLIRLNLTEFKYFAAFLGSVVTLNKSVENIVTFVLFAVQLAAKSTTAATAAGTFCDQQCVTLAADRLRFEFVAIQLHLLLKQCKSNDFHVD
jgi:hypothetical protein